MPSPDNIINAMLVTHSAEMTLTVREAAAHYGKCEETIRRWLRSGWLQGRKAVPHSRAWLVVIPPQEKPA